MQCQREWLHAITAQVLCFKEHFSHRYIVAIVIFRKLPPDHIGYDLIFGKFIRIFCNDNFSVPHNRNAVRDTEYLIQAVRNVNNGYTAFLQLMHDPKQDFHFVICKRCRRFIHND